MKTVFTIALLATLSATSANAFFSGHQKGKGPEANSESTAIGVGIGQGGKAISNNVNRNKNVNRNTNNNRATAIQGQANSQNVTFNEAEIPTFTGSAVLALQSLVNDECGRVAVIVPYSAHTCNVLKEAQAIAAAAVPVVGEKRAYGLGLVHMASFDRTMRQTLLRAGLVKPVK